MLGVLVSMVRLGDYQGGHGCGTRQGALGCPWVCRETDCVGMSTGMGKGRRYWGACRLEERFRVTMGIGDYQTTCVCREMEGAGGSLSVGTLGSWGAFGGGEQVRGWTCPLVPG